MRKELQEALSRYVTDTLTCMQLAGRFCQMFPKWTLWRETELEMMLDIRDRADSVHLSVAHVTRSEEKGKAFVEYVKSKFTGLTADGKLAELEAELSEVLKDALAGLQKLHCFLEAVETLALTSLHVFTDSQLLQLPGGGVQAAIVAARLVRSLLLGFRRDAALFFLPKLQNVDLLAHQLDRYVQTARLICDKMEQSCCGQLCLQTMDAAAVVKLGGDLSEDDVRRMLDHISQLEHIRMDPDFRTLFLFQDDSCHDFVKEFSDRQPRMSEFLKELEANAAQLDSMSKGAKISSVVGSSVGALGGVLSIVGLALSPVTAGASLALTVAGVGMGVTSGVNGVVTTVTEVGVNRTHQRKASEVLQRFADDATKLQECLEDEMQQTLARIQTSRTEAAVGVDLASAAKLLQSEEVAAGAAKVMAQEGKALCGVSRLASDVPDIGQAAVKGSLVASKSLRAGLIAANALFLGMDVFFICKDSIGLARGHESQAARLIRARAALWGSEMDSWKKIHDSLSDAMPTSGKKEAVLETPFYPHVGLQKQE